MPDINTPGYIPCPNYVMCGVMKPVDMHYLHGGRCVNCHVILGIDLDILAENVNAEDCPVCLEPGCARVKFPQCTHRVCGGCFAKLIHCGYDPDGACIENPHDGRCPICRVERPKPYPPENSGREDLQGWGFLVTASVLQFAVYILGNSGCEGFLGWVFLVTALVLQMAVYINIFVYCF
jgi:hypothetical protein